MWIVAFLVAIIILLLALMLFGGGGVFRERRLRGELISLREELRRVKEANVALRKTLGVGAEARMGRYEDLLEFARDLESLRSAIAGSKVCQRGLAKKYNLSPGPELLERILARPGIDSVLKERLASELLVGQVSRTIMRDLDTGATLDRAAADAGVPLAVAKSQVRRLQTLGYLDSHLKLTERGREALA